LKKQMNEEQRELLQAAEKAAELAYAPYSNFRVGAAVLTGGGVYTGANIETASTNLGTCAERVAIAHARMHGEARIKGIAVCCPDARPQADDSLAESAAMPCGACRQWIAELAPAAWLVTSSSVRVYHLEDLLPNAFQLKR
jgi:cytidine deaminase